MPCRHFNSRIRHIAACNDPEVWQMVIDLKADWENIDPVERGEALINLASCGCSARGLAKVLDCSAHTIRRYMDLADL